MSKYQLNETIKKFDKMISFISRRYSSSNYMQDDIKQELRIELVNVIKRFNPKKYRTKLCTYIYKSLMLYVHRTYVKLAYPYTYNTNARIYKYDKFVYNFKKEYGYPPSKHDILNNLNMSDVEYNRLTSFIKETQSKNFYDLSNNTIDNTINTLDSITTKKMLLSIVSKYLPTKQAFVLIKLYNLDDNGGCEVTELANMMKCGIKNIYGLKKKGIDNLQKYLIEHNHNIANKDLMLLKNNLGGLLNEL